jgi:hypothetical protein
MEYVVDVKAILLLGRITATKFFMWEFVAGLVLGGNVSVEVCVGLPINAAALLCCQLLQVVLSPRRALRCFAFDEGLRQESVPQRAQRYSSLHLLLTRIG